MLGFGSLVSTALVAVGSGGTPPVAVVGTETYFIGQFKPTVLKRIVGLYQNPDVEPFFAKETNIHFLAKYVPTTYILRPRLQQHQDYLPVVVSPEPHFVGTFKPTVYKINTSYRQIPDNQPPVIETNVHFVGKFTTTQLKSLQLYRQQYETSITFVPPVVETNPHFISIFKPTRINLLEQLRSCPANDIPAFVARYYFYTQIFG